MASPAPPLVAGLPVDARQRSDAGRPRRTPASHPAPGHRTRGGRAGPPAPLRPARAQRRRSRRCGPASSSRCSATGSTSSRSWLVVVIATGSALAIGPRLLRRDAPEPAPQPDRRHVRRSLGPQGGHDRQRPPAGGARPAPARSPRSRTCVLVYPLVFLVTTISIFFRPARAAILPRIVGEDDLLTANSALWVGETIADIVGYPLAGLFVVALGDAGAARVLGRRATYLASATLLDHDRRARRSSRQGGRRHRERCGRASSASCEAGWRFLRGEPTLLANTLQAAVGQFTHRHPHRPVADLRQGRVRATAPSAGRPSTASSRPGSGSATWSAGS